MRIFNKMKKTMLVLAASLFCVNVAFAESKTYLVSWENVDLTATQKTDENPSTLTGKAGEASEGIVLKLTGNVSKEWSSGNNAVTVPWEGTNVERTTIKLSNGAQNTLTMPEGWLATKVTFYSFINHNASKRESNTGGSKDNTGFGYRSSYWAEVAGVAYDATTATLMNVFVDGIRQSDNSVITQEGAYKNPDAISFDLDKASSFTFTNIGEQACFVLVIEAESAAGETSGYDLTAYNAAVAAAEAYKATLNAEDEMEAMLIMSVDDILGSAASWLEDVKAEGGTQEDVDYIAEDLNNNIALLKLQAEIEIVRAEGQEVLAKYPEETRTDNAGLVLALRNLPMMTMGYTAEQLQELVDAVKTAIPAFQKENNQLILDAAAKKANDYAATLDISEETGTMGQMEAYNTLTYYASAEVIAQIDVTSYDAVMEYSQTIDAMLAQYQPAIEKEKAVMAATTAATEAQATLEAGGTDEVGLADAIAKVNTILSEINLWDTEYTVADLTAAVEAMEVAEEAFRAANVVLEDGVYYLKNVAADEFITAGESWGTCAVFGEHGLDFTFTKQADGTYAIDSKLNNGGESHYFGAAGWMDAAVTGWTLTKLPEGTYTLTADGANYMGYDAANVWNAQTKVSVALTDATAEAAQWLILSKDDMVASLEGASVANPADATFYISCPNFGRNDTRFSTAWQGAPARGGANDNMCAERWNANFDVYQEMTGLRNGYYKVSVQGFYRAGNGGATGMERHAKLYANTVSTPLVNINTEAGNATFDGLSGWDVSDIAGKGLVPNNMNTASKAFTAGLYADNSVVVKVTDGNLRIGVKKDVQIANDWTIFDNFELTYYGEELPPVIADGTYYMKNVGAEKFLNGGNSWGTQASLVEHGLDATITYSNGTYTIDTNVPNGSAKHFLGSNGYVDSDVANWTIVPVGENFAISMDGVNYIGYDGSTSVMSLTLADATNANAQWQFVTKDELVAGLEGATEENPADATFFIQGQNFNRGDANRNAAWQGGPTLGGNNTNFCAEIWNNTFDVYQDLTGLPTGYYVVSVQGYYRAGTGGTTGTEQHASLYAGVNSTPLVNILSEAGNAAITGNTSDVAGYGLVPNDMTSASNAFSAGLYAGNSVVALVTDGTLRIGVKKDALIEFDWTIFDNFELAYIGTAIPAAFVPAVDSLNATIADATAWKATLNAENEVEAQVIAQIEQGMLPAAQAVAAQPASVAQVEEMIASVNMFVAQTNMTLGQMKAAEAQALLAEYENPAYYTEEFTAAYNEVFNIANGLAVGTSTWIDLEAAIKKMEAAQALFILQNVPAPTATVTGVINGHRIVELACDHVVDVEIFYSLGDEAMATKGLYTAPFMVSETTTVYAYAQFVDAETRETFKSAVAAVEIEAGTEVALNAPVIEETAEGVVITSDQSDVLGAPVDTIVYEFYPVLDEEAGTYSAAPSVTGTYTEALALAAGKLIAKAMSYGYTTSVAEYVLTSAPKVAYLCGATETTEAIYTALVNSGLNVTPMNYDEVSLTDADVEALAAYDLVVLAGNTGSGTNLAKTANLLVGKVNVLSTKSFWYKHYGTNGSNPGTADAPSLSLVKTVAAHPIFEGIEGDEFAVFNDMAKETGRYLQGNGSFNETVGLTQTALATANGTDCIGEGWLNGYGYVIIPVDGVQPEGYLTAEGEALFANVAWYLINGEQYVDPNVTIGGATGIEGIYADGFTAPADIYDVNGRMVKKAATSLEGLQKGLYLINGKKVLVK